MIEQYLQVAIRFIKEIYFQLNTKFGLEETQAFKFLKPYLLQVQDNPTYMGIAIALMAVLPYSLYKVISIPRKRRNKLNERENELDDRENKLSEHENELEQKLIEREMKCNGRERKLKKREKNVQEREKNVQERENKLNERENELDELEKKLNEREKNLNELKDGMEDEEEGIDRCDPRVIGKKDYDQAVAYSDKGNNKEAVKWYRLAADQGHAKAQSILGWMYENGQGVPQDYKEAVKWYRLAADQGDDFAQYHLGVLKMYDIGEGVPLDEVEIIKGLNQHGVLTLWHMTHKDNVEQILNKGILSHSLAYKKASPKDISDHDVQKWRELNDPIYGRKIHDYVPTYINIKNPMLYVKRNIQNELCLIEISLSVLSNDNYIFTDGNAASQNTKFYNLNEDLKQLPWEVLDSSYWSDLEDGKRKRCAEILIHPSIEPKHIIKIHCFSHETLEFLSRFNVQSKITGELFFVNKTSDSASNPFNDDIPF